MEIHTRSVSPCPAPPGCGHMYGLVITPVSLDLGDVPVSQLRVVLVSERWDVTRDVVCVM